MVTPVRLEPAAPQSQVKYSTTEPLRFLVFIFDQLLVPGMITSLRSKCMTSGCHHGRLITSWREKELTAYADFGLSQFDLGRIHSLYSFAMFSCYLTNYYTRNKHSVSHSLKKGQGDGQKKGTFDA